MSGGTEGWAKVGEFKTVGDLKKLLSNFNDEDDLQFINGPREDLYSMTDHNGLTLLGFQPPEDCYGVADAMLEARKKGGTE